MGYRSLRVINEDRVAPGKGFGTHGHRDMEIVSYVLEGALQHKDSMGNGSVMRPGDVQRMTAGTGVTHSEFNGSQVEGVHFLQIWVLPDRAGHAPGYEQIHFAPAEKRGKLRLIASPDGAAGSVAVHQDARIYAALLDGDEAVEHTIGPGRGAWIQVVKGDVQVNGEWLHAGDAATMDPVVATVVRIDHGTGAELLLFDLG